MSSHDAEIFNWHHDGGAIDDESLEIRGRKFFFLLVLFVIVLFTIVFFLYVRWICRPQAFSSFRRRHALQTPPSSQGLAAETIKKLPIVLHQTSSDQDSACECCICLSAFRDGEKVKVLPGCEHWFHCECVDKWLMNHSNCPLCRASLKFDDFSFPTILIQEPPIRHH
ncbi:hypothetical protein TanjilG_00671 [Lupinus angustifolius]|uniref:RING-type E3 ubiquitin transferase n=1 Tax=Lupinus angustifolius TaxID=3871 RepID=A0A4P1R7M5_LUPAN|nr:PREDICTED: RING-H2 finger protein ATL66-like [Lupinus angustifolius]OIW04111.1 hypothetical protein TanjilG_00671 [Lupinus angustifolius]